jgi:hypothetical protein
MIDLLIIGMLAALVYFCIMAGQALLSAGIGIILGVLLSDIFKSIIQYLLE